MALPLVPSTPTGFTLIFGVSISMAPYGGRAVVAWAAASAPDMDPYSGALLGVAVALVAALATYSGGEADPEFAADTERGEGNLRPHPVRCLGAHDQESIAYLFTNNAKTVPC